MKHSKIFIIIALCAFQEVFLSACSDDPEDVVFIPNIGGGGAGWQDETDASHTFFFLVDNEGEPESTFSGNENIDGVQDSFEGFYDEEYIEFTYTAAESDPGKVGVRYTGRIEGQPDTERIVLNTPQGQLILTRR